METSCIRIQIADKNRAVLHINWKGSAGHNLGLWKVFQLHLGNTNHNWDWSQTAHPPVKFQAPRQPLTKSPMLQIVIRPVWFFNRACQGKPPYAVVPLSRCPVGPPKKKQDNEVESYVEAVMISSSASIQRDTGTAQNSPNEWLLTGGGLLL